MSLIITCNAGSSNVKLAAFSGDVREAKAQVTHADAGKWLEDLRGKTIAAFGHRVVHGGGKYTSPTRITPEVLADLESYIPLAPLHQPHALTLIRALQKQFPGIPHIACFDTAFHHTIPLLEQMLPLPRQVTRAGMRRYGFHGLSYQYIASRLPEIAGDKANGCVIVAHMGNGASICGMKDRKSRAISMGFSTLDGLMMGTRSGSLDPGAVLYLLEKMSAEEVTKLLYHQSGLLGTSGISSDVRELLASPAPEAKLALDLFCHIAARQLTAIATATGGMDAVVFTGGIGEHAASVRTGICRYLGWLGIELNEKANAGNAQRISNGKTDVFVIPTDEESVIAKAVKELT